MENKILKFKTNINCSGCVANVQSLMDTEVGIGNWHVDTNNKEKILTVTATNINEEQIIQTIQKAGYKIEPLK